MLRDDFSERINRVIRGFAVHVCGQLGPFCDHHRSPSAFVALTAIWWSQYCSSCGFSSAVDTCQEICKGPEGNRRLRLPDLKTIGTKLVRSSALTSGRLNPSPPRKYRIYSRNSRNFLTKILYLNLGCVIYARKRFYINKSGYTGNFLNIVLKAWISRWRELRE